MQDLKQFKDPSTLNARLKDRERQGVLVTVGRWNGLIEEPRLQIDGQWVGVSVKVMG